MSDLLVMVVESKPEDLEIICEHLHNQRIHRLLCIEKASDAIKYLCEDPVDLVLISGKHEQYSALLHYIMKHLPYTMVMVIEESDGPLDGLRAISMGALEVVRSSELSEGLQESLPSVIKRSESYLRLYDATRVRS